jgi:RHS repeat-associated protein
VKLLRCSARDFDTETSLYYYRARYYDPSTGRFVAEDPIRFDAGVDFYSYVGNNPGLWPDPLGSCPPQKSCGLKKAPEYGPVGHTAHGFHFAWGAEFLNDATHDPKCCEVRQLISWNPGPRPHPGFYPPFDQPNHWYEDRDENDNRYGRRTGIYSDPEPFDNYHGNGYTGSDDPGGDYPSGQTLKFRLIVVDVCNGGKTIYTSKTISVTF